MKLFQKIFFVFTIAGLVLLYSSCNYVTHQTYSGNPVTEEEEPEPDYSITLSETYQDFVTYIFMGNRVKNFSTYFNVFYTAESDYNEAMKEIRTSTIAAYNRRLDSLNISPPVSPQLREKFNKVIERASKVIQFSKNTRFIDNAVLLIGESYYYMQDYYQAERSLNEFFAKFSTSKLRDKASLYLGRTNLKLGNGRDAETIFHNLIENSRDNAIKSDAAFDLGIYYLGQRNREEALKYLKSSVDFSTSSSARAEKQFLLARMYSRFNPELSAAAYKKAIDMSSDFDLKFYSRLNYCKALTEEGNYMLSDALLRDMTGDYRDYPHYRQLIDLQIGNNFLAQGNFERAKIAYYNVIVDYPGTVSASDAYYYLAEYYEYQMDDYFNAIVNYRRSAQETPSGNYSAIANNKFGILDRYYTLQAQASSTQKVTIPTLNEELEYYRNRRLDDRGIERQRDGQFDNRGGDEGGKGGGFAFKIESVTYDSTKDEEQYYDDGSDGSDSKIIDDSRFDGSEEMIKKGSDETKTGEIEETVSTQELRYNALFQLSELFLYDLNRPDSAVFYLDFIIREDDDAKNLAKAYYSKALIVKNQGNPVEANNIFNKIITEFPNTVFANESRRQLGMEVTEVQGESMDETFSVVSAKILNRNFEEAILNLHNIVAANSDTTIISRAYYTLGWIYENGIPDKDSVIHYYTLVKTMFPHSEYNEIASDKLLALVDPSEPPKEDTKPEEEKVEEESIKEVIHEEEMEKVESEIEEKSDETGEEKERLSQEEIERLLKELEEEGN